MYLILSVGDKAEGCSNMKETSTFLYKPESKSAKQSEKEKSLTTPYRYSQE